MNIAAIAKLINANAMTVMAKTQTPLEVTVIGNTQSQVDLLQVELERFLPRGLDLKGYVAEYLTSAQVRGRTRLAVVQWNGVQIDKSLDDSLNRSLYTCSDLLGTTSSSLRIDERGEPA